MSTVEKILAGMFILIGIIIVVRGQGANSVLTGAFGQLNTIINSLQGRAGGTT